MKKALITGVTGQDGVYLANYLLSLGYRVYGAIRRSSNLNNERLNYFNLYDNKNFKLVELDITDLASCQNFFRKYSVDEVYNLAAQSFVGLSFKQPILTANITGLGPLYILEAIKNSKRSIKFYQASSSELFGKVQEVPQSEKTNFYPRSPYGIAKLFAHWTSINYRESYGIFTCNGILFNHESPLRGLDFVTRKITNTVAKIKNKKAKILKLGNLDSRRDWGFAGDYVNMIHKMVQYDIPEDFVIATGITTSVREFTRMSFNAAGIDIEFSGKGINEVGFDKSSGRQLVAISKDLFRPAEVNLLVGDPSKAKKLLGWQPKVNLNQLIEMMVSFDLGITR